MAARAQGEVWGPVNLPSDLVREGVERKIALTHEINESHLLSMNDVSGYAIQATDGEIGHVDDFIVDDEPWIIRYIVVDTRNFWPGKKIVVAPPWIANVDWQNSNLYVNLSREAIKSAPPFDSDKLARAYETQLHAHYGQKNWWA